jgi:hypothetical protein
MLGCLRSTLHGGVEVALGRFCLAYECVPTRLLLGCESPDAGTRILPSRDCGKPITAPGCRACHARCPRIDSAVVAKGLK